MHAIADVISVTGFILVFFIVSLQKPLRTHKWMGFRTIFIGHIMSSARTKDGCFTCRVRRKRFWVPCEECFNLRLQCLKSHGQARPAWLTEKDYRKCMVVNAIAQWNSDPRNKLGDKILNLKQFEFAPPPSFHDSGSGSQHTRSTVKPLENPRSQTLGTGWGGEDLSRYGTGPPNGVAASSQESSMDTRQLIIGSDRYVQPFMGAWRIGHDQPPVADLSYIHPPSHPPFQEYGSIPPAYSLGNDAREWHPCFHFGG
ncbi:uncharacterized protein EI90DRAFT_3075990 [Cantharellus anzutake]|uniref:uncharacterized protein n=1 Tax=Cantharellus anzutake TaxID=1750568 RepID=UPI0019063612|nr:uncharacterized protein EI90DRAFT_3075990 [Cantharellus anzutake]KAF8324360.1 hypothetical protein EI90DRAFT_3075990 [Cantharellus anzutake]